MKYSNFKVLYLQNYSSDCYETYRGYLMSDRKPKYKFSSDSKFCHNTFLY